LFSETPNYRALGEAVMGREKFRWHFGPMYYRGRLGDNQVKVLIVGQEGAQDESLTHRSFTGGTGARMQHVLAHLGINHSYLFLNTFVYPILGQYSGSKLQWLAQDPASPIAMQRQKLFDYAAQRNDLRLVIAVGTAAKESIESWILARGGTCPGGAIDLSSASGHVLGPNTKVVGVRHPGGAASGNLDAIKLDFLAAMQKIEVWANADPNWLPPDPGCSRAAAANYVYESAPIPFRDFPFGTAWRLGRGGTSSNRTDDQRSIQMFSAAGKHNGTGHILSYANAANGSKEGYVDAAKDVPYEPPVEDYTDFDKGPDASFARLMLGGRSGYHWPDFSALGADAHPSFGRGAIYRGRPRQATVIVLADQQSHDDLFTGRALTGEAGQRFHGFLEAIGVTHSYFILRTLPIDSLDLPSSIEKDLVDDPQTRKVVSKIVETAAKANKRPKVLLAMGPMAQRLAPHINPTGLPVVELESWRQTHTLASWQAALTTLSGLGFGKDATASFTFDGKRRQIPRYDLPYGTLRWQGSSGNRALKARRDGEVSPDYFKLSQPKWVFNLEPAPLSADERKAIEAAPK
jgi:uracil-DNA glycosylase